MLKPVRPSNLLLPFESLVNRCIAQDQKLAEGISQHCGKVLWLQVTAPELDIYIHLYRASVTLGFDPPELPAGDLSAGHHHDNQAPVENDGNARNEPPPAGPVTEAGSAEADARISGSALTLLRLLIEREAERPLVDPALQISGDVEFVQSVYHLFKTMRIDWQEPLSRVIGDVPTHGLEQLIDSLKSFTRQAADSTRRNLDEYLHEESRLVPPRNQVEAFDCEMDELRLRLDRLHARVQELSAGVDRHCQAPRE